MDWRDWPFGVSLLWCGLLAYIWVGSVNKVAGHMTEYFFRFVKKYRRK
jgi:hypothetical protein